MWGHGKKGFGLARLKHWLGLSDNVLTRDLRDMTVDNGPETTSGVCRGVAPDGALLLATGAGVKRVYSGVVRKS